MQRTIALCLLSTVGCLTAADTVSEADLRAAASRSIALIQKTQRVWEKKQSCVSCHQQVFPLMVLGLARERGVALDEGYLQSSTANWFGYLANVNRAVQGSHEIEVIGSTGLVLYSGAMAGFPHTAVTGIYARRIARRQNNDGSWTPFDMRPPQSGSRFTGTAVGLRVVQTYLPDAMKTERDACVRAAAGWLQRSSPVDTEDRTMRLLGLHWAGEDATAAAADLLAGQRDDGGWSQIPARASDAYATGEALYALHEAGTLSTGDVPYQRGLRFLLRTQKPDGSWLVETRIHAPAPLSPPYFESGFPYGHSQFISTMGTSWATMAMLLSVEKQGAPKPLDVSALQPKQDAPWLETTLFGSPAELKALLDNGLDPNTATPGGTSLLMMAAPDPAKVRLLIERGANVNAHSKTRYTALMIAADHRAPDSVSILLEHGAEVSPRKGEPAMFGMTPLMFAALSGDTESARLLLDHGAVVSGMIVLGGIIPDMRAIDIAAQDRDVPMSELLVSHGAGVNEGDPVYGMATLNSSVFGNSLEHARAMIKLGADVNRVDTLGWTPLEWAANVDYGDSEMIRLLLASGARPDMKNKDGLTALDIAKKHGYSHHAELLEAALQKNR